MASISAKFAMSFATSHVLTKHIQKFHKFDSSQSDHKDLDLDIDVLYDADDILSCVKSFKEKINEHICRVCNLKFLTGRMLKLHNSRHHPQLNKKSKSEEKIIVEAEHVHKAKVKQEVGMGLSCIKCNDKFSTKQQLTTHMIKKHQKNEKYKRRKYALSRKVTTWKCGTCCKGFKSMAALADHTVIHQTYVKKEHTETSTTKPDGTYCVTCCRNFASKADLHTHFKEEHEKNKVNVVNATKLSAPNICLTST